MKTFGTGRNIFWKGWDGTKKIGTGWDGTKKFGTGQDGTEKFGTGRDKTKNFWKGRDGTGRQDFLMGRDGTGRIFKGRDGTKKGSLLTLLVSIHQRNKLISIAIVFAFICHSEGKHSSMTFLTSSRLQSISKHINQGY